MAYWIEHSNKSNCSSQKCFKFLRLPEVYHCQHILPLLISFLVKVMEDPSGADFLALKILGHLQCERGLKLWPWD